MANFTLNFTGIRIADPIAGVLTTSLSNYNAASSGALIPITKTEYDALATAVANVTKTGLQDAHLNDQRVSITTSKHILRQHTATPAKFTKMIAGYTFAAKVGVTTPGTGTQFANGASVNYFGYQLGYAPAVNTNGVALSNPSTFSATAYTSSVATSLTYIHFVVKNANVVSPANALLSVLYPLNIHSGSIATSESGVDLAYLNNAVDVTGIALSTWLNTYTMGVQYLQTPTKQW